MKNLLRLGLALLLTSATAAQTATTIAAPSEKTLEITPSETWTDSGIDLHPGDRVEISASVVGTGTGLCDPQGMTGASNPGKLPVESALPTQYSSRLRRLEEQAREFVLRLSVICDFRQ